MVALILAVVAAAIFGFRGTDATMMRLSKELARERQHIEGITNIRRDTRKAHVAMLERWLTAGYEQDGREQAIRTQVAAVINDAVAFAAHCAEPETQRCASLLRALGAWRDSVDRTLDQAEEARSVEELHNHIAAIDREAESILALNSAAAKGNDELAARIRRRRGTTRLWLVVFAVAAVGGAFSWHLRGRAKARVAAAERASREQEQHAAELEGRVDERTRELAESNARLQDSLERLHAAQRDLVNASRRAGMADVATSVLHNVGNVLNSVNVCAAVVMERMREPKAAGVAKVSQLLRKHEGDLGVFFTRDDRGRRLPLYLEKLSEAVAAEQASQVREMAELQKHVDHIKAVISRQLADAKVGGMVEQVRMGDLVDDVLGLNLVGKERDDIEMVREQAPPMDITVDRHKVLQILLNLLSNARHAVRDGIGPLRRITVRTRTDGDRFAIEVEDTGCGIAEENLARVFAYGFTNKKEGHGFGLHFAACAAAEMGGTLQCRSAGPQKGATFVLELPIHAKALG